MVQDELKQEELPEPINIIITNHGSYDGLVLLGREVSKIEGVLTINIHVGEPGQNLRVIGKQPDEPLRQIKPAG